MDVVLLCIVAGPVCIVAWMIGAMVYDDVSWRRSVRRREAARKEKLAAMTREQRRDFLRAERRAGQACMMAWFGMSQPRVTVTVRYY
jgi:hypothetical protein